MSWREVLTAAGYWDGGGLLRVPTTGTTGGEPRVVLRTVESWADSFDHFTSLSGITDADVVAAVGPPTSMFVYARAHAAHVGARTVEGDRWHPDALDGATVAHLTPTMLQDLLEGRAARARRSLRLAVVAGGALGVLTSARARDAGIEVLRYYGAAELSFVAIGGVRLEPFPRVQVESRQGVLWVRSPWTASGYADDAAGPLHTDGEWCSVGDRGSVLDGAVEVHGRDGWVICGGVSISTAEVETVLRQAPGVSDCCVLGRPHERLGQVLAAVVVGGERSTVAAHCRALMPPTSRPVQWYSTDRLPSTAAGKIDDAAVARAIETGAIERWR